MNDIKLHPFISAEEVQRLVGNLARRVSADYSELLGPDEAIHVVITLRGAFLFGADLIRELTVPAQVDFVRVKSYGSGTQSSGTVKMTKDMEDSPRDAHILILDEVADSGRTLAFLTDRFKDTGAKSVRICALLNKPSRREIPVKIDYIGKDIDDKFIVGYGLDFNEAYRNLPAIYFIG